MKRNTRKYKVIYEIEKCVGAGACVVISPTYWQLDKYGKAKLKLGKKISNRFELEIDEKDLKQMLKAAKACPVRCIHIIDKKTEKRII